MIRPLIVSVFFIGLMFALTSCKVRKGCPSNGANVGAEKIMSGDPQAMKSIKGGKKYKMNKF